MLTSPNVNESIKLSFDSLVNCIDAVLTGTNVNDSNILSIDFIVNGIDAVLTGQTLTSLPTAPGVVLVHSILTT